MDIENKGRPLILRCKLTMERVKVPTHTGSATSNTLCNKCLRSKTLMKAGNCLRTCLACILSKPFRLFVQYYIVFGCSRLRISTGKLVILSEICIRVTFHFRTCYKYVPLNILYEHYVIKGHTTLVIFNFLPLTIPT
jgi:hypothetical protein